MNDIKRFPPLAIASFRSSALVLDIRMVEVWLYSAMSEDLSGRGISLSTVNKLFRLLVCGNKDINLVWKHVCKRVTTDTPLRNATGNSSEKSPVKVSDFVDGSEAARQDFRDLQCSCAS